MKTTIEPLEDGNALIRIPIEFRYCNGRKRIFYPELPDEQLKINEPLAKSAARRGCSFGFMVFGSETTRPSVTSRIPRRMRARIVRHLRKLPYFSVAFSCFKLYIIIGSCLSFPCGEDARTG